VISDKDVLGADIPVDNIEGLLVKIFQLVGVMQAGTDPGGDKEFIGQ